MDPRPPRCPVPAECPTRLLPHSSAGEGQTGLECKVGGGGGCPASGRARASWGGKMKWREAQSLGKIPPLSGPGLLHDKQRWRVPKMGNNRSALFQALHLHPGVLVCHPSIQPSIIYRTLVIYHTTPQQEHYVPCETVSCTRPGVHVCSACACIPGPQPTSPAQQGRASLAALTQWPGAWWILAEGYPASPSLLSAEKDAPPGPHMCCALRL